MSGKMIVRLSKVMLSVSLLFLHIWSYSIAAYIPKLLRECISTVYEATDSPNCTQALKELYSIIRENRILTSDTTIYGAVKEVLGIIRSSHSKDQKEIIEYLEQYLNDLNNRAILLTINGDASQVQSWSTGLIGRSMREEREAYELLCLSNELSGNLMLCGSIDMNSIALNSRIIASLFKNFPLHTIRNSINFNANDMTNSLSVTPPVIIGSTGVGASSVNAWALSLSTSQQYPVNMQFVVPSDLEKNKSMTLEVGLLIPNNGFDEGYVNFQVQTKSVEADHSFNASKIAWTHTNTSGNIKVKESLTEGNVKYILVKIPLKSSDMKPGYFTLLNISRISPTKSKTEYAGDVNIVAAVFKYTTE